MRTARVRPRGHPCRLPQCPRPNPSSRTVRIGSEGVGARLSAKAAIPTNPKSDEKLVSSTTSMMAMNIASTKMGTNSDRTQVQYSVRVERCWPHQGGNR